MAPDHIGFGLSSRSSRKEDHRPQAHAEAFAALLDDLDVHDVTLFLTDWGGPIGLDFARRHPDRVKRLNNPKAWFWPVNRDPHFWFFSRMMA
ncbi:MAG: alpha/beta fold hydrolase, partial [bacterium]|nr:alpha/beta fold hydrolase [bacterium]